MSRISWRNIGKEGLGLDEEASFILLRLMVSFDAFVCI